ncbi:MULTISPECIES: ABC transporter permease [Virgibacillus]|uniref:ABC transporter permease n=1 Tax=Virgibacillus pantothenticus TaxID=1473 RepID=A0A0L0QPZ2_VIRPA|nr:MULTISPECIES: ABC transporter permease [Virgibacillus]API90742.1 hypothetical protein BKP57_02015 [Virgibacillus sp. 6R]KNE20690.1 hypothetical protein AFK71_20340 [Virgibacillus pantothenticus]MBS7427657.1 ABC transporter permease [Virgibacillus sp. 19R1-5]MED3739368.1 ABC transporter permease [Virgibacillus pantothenticus]QTY17547.1 ABC transporter permease [Virgibacillus pantothenticus]
MLDLIRNELTKFVFSRYNMVILLFVTIILITLFLIFPFIFKYDNDQQTYHGKDWKQQVEKKQDSLIKKNQEIKKGSDITPRDSADISMNEFEIKRLESYKERNIIPPAKNNTFDNILTATGLNNLITISVIVFSGLIISKEFSDFTIKTIFLQPIKKSKVIFSKIITVTFTVFFYVVVLYFLTAILSSLIANNNFVSNIVYFDYNKEGYQIVNFYSLLFKFIIGDFLYALIFSLLSISVVLLFKGNSLSIGIPMVFLFTWSSISGFLGGHIPLDYLIPNHWDLNKHFGLLEPVNLSNSSYLTSLFISLITIFVLIFIIINLFKHTKIN